VIPPVANRFVAGETTDEALDHARDLGEHDVGAILNLLGEHYHERDPADEDAAAYRRLVEEIATSDARACVSVKPSQLGLFVSEEAFRENLAAVVEHAAEHDVFVWLDMENHATVDATLDAFEHHARREGSVGVCVQANLRRTREDLERLAPLPGKVRLVKGAYDPPEDVALQGKDAIDEAYRDHLAYVFEQFDGGIAVGSHDPAMVGHAEALYEDHGTDFEIQMLMGVREEAQYELAAEHEVRQYVPYGGKWLSYFYRRLAERTENLTFALRALVQG
jgi:proline dehydrogenase